MIKFQQTSGSVLRDHFIFRGSWWLVDFGFNAPILAHESDQQSTNFNDSEGTSDFPPQCWILLISPYHKGSTD